MRHATRAGYRFQEETFGKIVRAVPQFFPAAKFDRRNRKMHLVNQISLEKLEHRFNATADAHVFAIGRFKRLCECIVGRRIKKMKRRVPQGY